MGAVCNSCIHDGVSQSSHLEIETIEKKPANRDIMKNIVLIQRSWREHMSRKALKNKSRFS